MIGRDHRLRAADQGGTPAQRGDDTRPVREAQGRGRIKTFTVEEKVIV